MYNEPYLADGVQLVPSSAADCLHNMVQLIRASHTDMVLVRSGHMDRLGKIRRKARKTVWQHWHMVINYRSCHAEHGRCPNNQQRWTAGCGVAPKHPPEKTGMPATYMALRAHMAKQRALYLGQLEAPEAW